jgi:PTS system galactitol-specific IIA component
MFMTDNMPVLENLALDEKNILVNFAAQDRTDVIKRLGGLLIENGYVKNTYIQAVLDREEIFPTGLQTTSLGFAIPHTDTEHVLHSAIAVATLRQPVDFQGMGTPDVSIPVKIVMMLAISNPKAVVQVLRSTISILENESALNALLEAKSKLEVKQIVEEHIRTMAKTISGDGSGHAS